MAREIQFNSQLAASKNGASINLSVSKVLDMAGNSMIQETQDITTGGVALTFGDVSGAPKKLIVVNLDATNFVEIDSANTFDKFPQKLVAGDFALLSPQTATIYARANTATVRVWKGAVQA